MKIFRRAARSHSKQDNLAAPSSPAVPEIITPSVATRSTTDSTVLPPPSSPSPVNTPTMTSLPSVDVPNDSLNNMSKSKNSGQETKETIPKKPKKKKRSKKSSTSDRRPMEASESPSSSSRVVTPPVEVPQPSLLTTVRDLHQEGILLDMTRSFAENASHRFGAKAAKAFGSSIKKTRDAGRAFGSDASFILGFVWLLTTCINADVSFAATVVYMMMYAGFCIWLLDATMGRRRDKKKSRRRDREEDQRRNHR